MSDAPPLRSEPALSDADWKTLRDLLRSRALHHGEREVLRRLLTHHGRLGSLVRLPGTPFRAPIPREEPET